MQRFVVLSASSHQCLVPQFSPVTSWKSSRDGRATLSVQSGGRRPRMNDNISVSFPLIRSEDFRANLCCEGYNGGRGGATHRNFFGPALGTSRRKFGTRSRSVSRGSLGNRRQGSYPEPSDSHQQQQQQKHHLGHQRNNRQVVDSIRDFSSDSWWPDDADDDNRDDADLKEDAGICSADLWTSRIVLQLSLFWNLLGFSPSKVDEWIVSHEARRRLNSSNKRNDPFSSSGFSSSSTMLNNNPLGDLFEGDNDLSLGNLRDKFSSVRFPQFLSAATPQFRARDYLSGAMDSLHSLLYPQWITRMTQTYGSSFMLLVTLGYLTQGFRCFPWFAVGYMLKDGLQVDPGYMQFLLSSAALPMVAKPIYGIISDTLYIRGAHRVPYLAIAGVLQLISWGALALVPHATSSAVLLTAALTFGNLGAGIADVMNDALVAEVSKKQKGSEQGELQSFVWLIMASGGLLGNLLGGLALKKMQLTTMYFIFLILLGLHLVICLFVNEGSFDLAPLLHPSSRKDGLAEENSVAPRDGQKRTKGAKAAEIGKMPSISGPSLCSQLEDQVRLLGGLLQKQEILRTLLWFCASYAVVPVLGSSIFFFQTQVLRIDPTFIGFSRMVGQVGLMVGSQLYSGVLKGLPLRKLLGSVQLLLSFCMLSDMVLVKRLNLELGIPDKFYVLGASAFVDCVSQFKVLPVIVHLGRLCPPGSEGSLMAFFSSCHCLAGLLSGYFGVALAQHLQISAQSFEGLPIGIFIQAMFALLPILCINLIPGESKTKAEKVAEKVE